MTINDFTFLALIGRMKTLLANYDKEQGSSAEAIEVIDLSFVMNNECAY